MKQLSKLPIYSPNKRYLHVKEIAEDDQLAIIPDYSIVSYENALLTPTNHVFVRGRYVPTGLINPYDDKNLSLGKKMYLLLKFRFLNHVKHHSGTFLFAYDIWSNNYYHWLCEALPRLVIMHNNNPHSVIILPANLKKNAFIPDSLDILKMRYEYVNTDISHVFTTLTTIQCSPPLANVNPFHLLTLKTHLMNALHKNAAKKGWRKLYISRAHASHRRIENEHEIIPLLTQYGYEIIHAEMLSYKEQISIFHEAAYCIALHGAGLANWMFMQAESRVMEIRISTWNKQPLCFWRLANLFNLNWTYHLARPAPEDSNFNNVTIDYDTFCKDLEAFHK